MIAAPKFPLQPMFHFVASTGRTATTFIAAVLDALPGVSACHEGYVSAEKDADPILPLINLENASSFRDPAQATAVVAAKRGPEAIAVARRQTGSDVIIDVAYYNAVLATALLEGCAESRMVAIIREPEAFVRSATCISGEDLLPVGWPDPSKPLSAREKFIGMGRIRPVKGTKEAALWPAWSAIERNIWLWQATNERLLAAAADHPARSLVLDFDILRSDRERFFSMMLGHFGLASPDGLEESLEAAAGKKNSKPSGYQIPEADSWSDSERAMLEQARERIGALKKHVNVD